MTATRSKNNASRPAKARSPKATADPETTVPGLDAAAAQQAIAILSERLAALLDLQLTLKHVHWNVVGVNFMSVHRLLDEQVATVRTMSDAVAERIATLGGEARGTPGAIVATRSWDDYELNRAPTVRHLAALDRVYGGVIGDHRRALDVLGDADPVSEDLVVAQLHDLEQYQWFVRAHLQNSAGEVVFRATEQDSQPDD